MCLQCQKWDLVKIKNKVAWWSHRRCGKEPKRGHHLDQLWADHATDTNEKKWQAQQMSRLTTRRSQQTNRPAAGSHAQRSDRRMEEVHLREQSVCNLKTQLFSQPCRWKSGAVRHLSEAFLLRQRSHWSPWGTHGWPVHLWPSRGGGNIRHLICRLHARVEVIRG